MKIVLNNFFVVIFNLTSLLLLFHRETKNFVIFNDSIFII